MGMSEFKLKKRQKFLRTLAQVSALLISGILVTELFLAKEKHEVLFKCFDCLIEIAAAAIVTFVFDYYAKRVDSHLSERLTNFEKFFGKDASDGKVNLVFGRRGHEGDGPKSHYSFLPAEGDHRLAPEGTNYWLAQQDVRIASYLTELFTNLSQKCQLQTLLDSDVTKADIRSLHGACYIAAGLGFNRLTEVLRCISGGQLFQVRHWKFKFRNEHNAELCTDDLTVGSHQTQILAGEKLDYAILARIVLKTKTPTSGKFKCSVHFIIAGRSAQGTSAAGWYLANKWEDMYNELLTCTHDVNSQNLLMVLHHPVGLKNNQLSETECDAAAAPFPISDLNNAVHVESPVTTFDEQAVTMDNLIENPEIDRKYKTERQRKFSDPAYIVPKLASEMV